MRQTNFQMIDKKLAKKNAELQEICETRQKLADKEKEICPSIDKLQNQKIEVIFEQVKKEIKSENLKVSSASIIPLLEVLRNTRQIEDYNENEEFADEKAEIISTENLASERNYSDPRWYSAEDIQQKHWALKENATPELLEEG